MPSIGQAKRLRALRRRKGRAELGMFLAEGPRVVADLLDTEIPVHLALYTTASAGDPAVSEVIERLRSSDIPVEEVPASEFEEFADTVTPQGILAMADIPAWSLTDVTRPRLAVLDAVQDPGNVGTLIRAAEALGAGGICLLPGTADPWSPKTVRAAAGSSFRIPVVEVALPELRSWCDARGAALLASATDGEAAVRRSERDAVALVLGNEGAGVSAAVLEAADGIVGIPLLGGADSLNVAIAGAILMDRMFGS